METAVALAGFAATVLGLLIAWFSRTDQLLREIRNVLMEIRDDLRR